MPYITDEEYEEYLELKKKDKERKQFLEKYSTKLPEVQQKRKNMLSLVSMAARYAKRLEEFRKYFQQDVFDLQLKEEFEYLTGRVIKYRNGKPYLKHWFQKKLGEYGWSTKIDHYYGILQIEKIEPKVIK